MKTDRDMAENILNRVTSIKEQRVQRSKMIGKIASVACVLAVVFAMSLTFIGYDTPQEPLDSNVNLTDTSVRTNENKGFFLMVANAADETETTFSKETNVNIPLGGILQIKNTNGMSQEAINRINYELKLRLKELYGLDDGFSVTGRDGVTAVYFGTADTLRFKLADPSAVDYITLYCTDTGKLTVFDETVLGDLKETVRQGNEIVITADEYVNIYGKDDGMHIRWFLSDDYANELDENTVLSEISDTITGKVTYKDGTEELFTITLNFDDEGILSSTYSSRIAYYPIAE